MDRIGDKYRLGPRLGGGGMAEVFFAKLVGAEGFSRPVAIKRVLPGYSADPNFAEMFVAEARIASLLTHPCVVPVIDFDRDDEGRLFLVMELVEGKDLRELGSSGRLPLGITAHVVAELLSGLSYAHRLEHDGRPMQIVHRDVSPHNVLISWSGAVKLTDFGIAKAAAASPITQTGVVKGKVAYLSPEQARAESIDGRSDLFAVGIILHELLTGKRLFAVKTGAPDAVIVHRVLSLDIPSPRSAVPEISPALDAVCMRLLARDKTDRFDNAKAALEALMSCPEMTARGQLDLAALMVERFPGDAPSSASHQPTHVPAAMPTGDFTASGALAPQTRRERPSGPTEVEGTSPSPTAMTPTRMLAEDPSFGGTKNTVYLFVASVLLVVAGVLAWKLWLVSTPTAPLEVQTTAPSYEPTDPTNAPTATPRVVAEPPPPPIEVAKPPPKRRAKRRARRVTKVEPAAVAEPVVEAASPPPVEAPPPPLAAPPTELPPPKKIGDDILLPDL